MLFKLAFVMQRLKKYLQKIFVMINEDGGGGKQFLDFMGGDIELMGVPPLGKTLNKSMAPNFVMKIGHTL